MNYWSGRVLEETGTDALISESGMMEKKNLEVADNHKIQAMTVGIGEHSRGWGGGRREIGVTGQRTRIDLEISCSECFLGTHSAT